MDALSLTMSHLSRRSGAVVELFVKKELYIRIGGAKKKGGGGGGFL